MTFLLKNVADEFLRKPVDPKQNPFKEPTVEPKSKAKPKGLSQEDISFEPSEDELGFESSDESLEADEGGINFEPSAEELDIHERGKRRDPEAATGAEVDVGTESPITSAPEFAAITEPDEGTKLWAEPDKDSGFFKDLWKGMTKQLRDEEAERAKSANAYAISQSTNISIGDAYEHMDQITKELGIRGQPTFRELIEGFALAGVTAGLVTNPVAVTIGAGVFMGLYEVENAVISKISDRYEYKFGAGRGMSDLMPEGTNQTAEDLVWLADEAWKVVLGGYAAKTATPKVHKAAQDIYTKFTKDISTKYNMPENVYISPNKIREFHGRGREEVISKAESDLLKGLEIPRDQYVQAMKQGMDIEVPANKIITSADKPWWGALKRIIKAKPSFSETVVGEVKPTAKTHMERLAPPTKAAPKAGTRPYDVEPEATFISKKGNEYEKVSGKWYDAKGKVVNNRFVIEAAEKGKVGPESKEPVVEEPKVAKSMLKETDLLSTKGKPYPVRKVAEATRKRKKLEDTHDVVEVEGGFVLRPRVEEVTKAEPIEGGKGKGEPAKIKTKKTEDFESTGEWEVTDGTNSERIFRDPESKDWYSVSDMDAASKPSDVFPIGQTKKEAIANVKQRWEDRSKIEQTKTLYHGTSDSYTRSKDMPKGHRGYFLTEDPKVAGKFGDRVLEAEVSTDKVFDARTASDTDVKAVAANYRKMRNVPEGKVSNLIKRMKRGDYTVYEDWAMQAALEDLGYKGNWQVEDESSTVRLFHRKDFDFIQKGKEPTPEELPPEADADKIAAIEEEYGKPIDRITDEEIERFFDKAIEGEEAPIELSPSESPFRQKDPEFTKKQLSLLPDYKKIDTPDQLVAKMESELNAHLDGEKVDVGVTKKLLSDLSEASKLWATGEEAPPGIFSDMNMSELVEFSEYLGELNKWTGKAIPEDTGVRLDMMIPLDKTPKAVGDFFRDRQVKKIKFKNLFRHRELYDETGFWLGKDRKWRYEINPNQMKKKFKFSKPSQVQGKPLGDLYSFPGLFDTYPNLKDVTLHIEDMPNRDHGYFDPNDNKIALNKKHIGNSMYTFIHELQHGINRTVGAFRGSSIGAEKESLMKSRLKEIIEKVDDPDLKYNLEDAISRDLNDWYFKSIVKYLKDNRETFGLEHTDLSFLELSIETGAKVRYFTNPGEMESRLVEKRLGMSDQARRNTPPWETLDELVAEEGFGTEVGKTLYSGPEAAIFDAAKSIYNKVTNRGKTKLKPQQEAPAPFSVKERAREAIIDRRAKLGLRSYEVNKLTTELEHSYSEKQLEAAFFHIEGTGVPKELNRPDLEKVLSNNKKSLGEIAEKVKAFHKQQWADIKEVWPDLTTKQIEDYVTHLYEVPRRRRAEAVNLFSTFSGSLEKRYIPTMKKAIEHGFMPKTLNVAEVIKANSAIVNRAMANTEYVKQMLEMKEDGVSLIQRSDEDIPLDWVEVDYPALTRRLPLKKSEAKKKGEFVKETKVKVHPDLVRPLKAIFEERFDHPVISAYEATNGIMKKSLLSITLFHHGALGETGIALMGPVKTGKIYLDPVKIYNGLVRGNYEMFKNEELAKDAIAHNVQFGATADIPVARIQGYLDDLARKTSDVPMAGRLTKLLKGFNSTWDKALWSYLHDTLKLYGYEAEVAKLDPNLTAAETRKAKIEIGQFVNDTFGGQNWETLMITPKEVQMMTWSLLSADWTVSTTRQALAPTGVGKIYKESKGLRRKVGSKYWLKAALFFGIGMNMLNATFRKSDMEDNPQYYEDKDYDFFDYTMFGNTVGKKTYLFRGRYEDGSERYIRWGKQFRDFFELLLNPMNKLGGKGAPLPQLASQILTGRTLSGYTNKDLEDADTRLERATAILKTVAKSPVPITIQKFMREDMEFKPLDVVMRSSKGMSRYNAVNYFKKAIVDGDEDLLRDVYVGSVRNNLPAYSLFQNALGWAEHEAIAALAENTEDIKDVEGKLETAATPAERKRYGIILKQLHKEKASIETGFRLLKTAVKRAETYSNLEKNRKNVNPKLP